MKYILLLSLVFMSCSLYQSQRWFEIDDTTWSRINIDKSDTKQVSDWVNTNKNIKYVAARASDDDQNFKPVQIILDEKEAMCTGKALVAIAIYYKETGNVSKLAAGVHKGVKHMAPAFRGKIIYEEDFKVDYYIDWDQIKDYMYMNGY